MGSVEFSSGERRVRDLVREVVAGLAPSELPVMDGLFTLDDATALRRLTGEERPREPLGFGVGEIAVLITPVVWLALDQAARRFVDAALDSGTRKSTALLGRLFRRRQPPATVPPLTREQVVEVRRLVLETARQRGLPARRATEIANAVMAALILAESDTPGDEGPDTPTAAGAPRRE